MPSELVFLLGAVFCAVLPKAHLQVINSQYCPPRYPKPDYEGTSPSGAPIFAQCTLGDPIACRAGFYCQPSPNLPGSNYCCQQDFGCPGIYSSAEIDQGSTFPRSCGAVVTGPRACGGGYQCVYSSIANQQICCSTSSGITGNYCPNGGQVANQGGGPQRCTLGVSDCPPGYSCQSGYCCSVQSQGFCPIGSTPALDGNGLPEACSPPFTNCPPGFECTTDFGGSYCCSVGGINPPPGSQYCPAGTQPYMPGNGYNQPQSCSGSAAGSCPPGYACQAGPLGGFYCCTSQNSISTQFCPQGSSPQSGYPIQCQPGSYGQPCNYGYSCQNSGYSNNYYCCSTRASNPGGYCPPGSNPLSQPGGYPQSCNPGYNSCGIGYSCQSTGYGGQSYCCSINNGNSQYCPSGSSPWFYPGTNSPCSCTIGISRCPGASTCQCPNGPGSYGAHGYCCCAFSG